MISNNSLKVKCLFVSAQAFEGVGCCLIVVPRVCIQSDGSSLVGEHVGTCMYGEFLLAMR